MGRGFFLMIDGDNPARTLPQCKCFFIFYFILFYFSNFTGVRRFLLLFTFFRSGFFSIWSFSLHSRVLFFVSLLSRVCVSGRGGVVGRPTFVLPFVSKNLSTVYTVFLSIHGLQQSLIIPVFFGHVIMNDYKGVSMLQKFHRYITI